MRPTFYYSITYGLQGCYMPDSHLGPHSGRTRRELRSVVADALELYEMPKRAIRTVRLNQLWKHIRRSGSSTAHFHITHGQHNVLSFYGLTEAEFAELDAAEKDF